MTDVAKEGQGGLGFVLGFWGVMLIYAALIVTWLESVLGSAFRVQE